MKIALNMGGDPTLSPAAAHAKAVEHDLSGARGGDWTAKSRLAVEFMPLLQTLAERRSADKAKINDLIQAGKEGLFLAVRKYKKGAPSARFQVFALTYIESAMDRVGKKRGGLFGWLRRG